MKCSPFARPTRAETQAFTLVELAVAGALIGIVGLVTFGVLRSSLILSSQNTGINVSSFHGRQMIDRVGDRARYSLVQPTLMTKDGADVSGTTADGIRMKRFLGSPYIIKESGGGMGDILAASTQFVVEFRNDLPEPSVGDFMLMESVSRPELEISAITVLSPSGTTLRRQITTTTAIGEVARPAYYRVSGLLYRKEAFAFVATEAGTNPRYDLRYFSRVKGNTNFASAASYRVMASGYRQVSGQAFFSNITSSGGNATTLLRALVPGSGKPEYIERGKTASSFTTVPVQLRLWALNK